ncbi:MAG: hypothetical protein EB082_13595 [Verrucomicrobia bacterium]|nr:hypothetical protein [Verrucomicrobiota bacterium]NBU11367.1 hypothetical protein [Pseudomonadota bacterium]NDD39416.1 hypothetical protein [Verrucomicrobiota bacterium]NDE99407.1 hypothetical protein [Verrucomicrobiota bacterium]
MKKPVKLGLWLLAFAGLAMLGLWLEHERAKARLAAFKAQLVAKGEKLAIADHVPKLPPALSNAAPDFITVAKRLPEFNSEWYAPRMHLVAPSRARVMWMQPELPTDKFPDLWPELCAYRELNRETFSNLVTLAERPKMVFDLKLESGADLLLPHLSDLKKANMLLGYAAMVDLHQGQPAEAFANWQTCVRVGGRFHEALLISQLVRMAMGFNALTVTWEALQTNAWSPVQLAAIQADWQAFEGASMAETAWSMECVFGDIEAKRMRTDSKRANRYLEFLGSGGMAFGSTSASFWDDLKDDPEKAAQRVGTAAHLFAWRGWLSYSDEQLSLQHAQALLDGARTTTRSNSYQLGKAVTATAMSRLPKASRWFILSRDSVFFTPTTQADRFAKFETCHRLTFTAIALHRHRLKHGKFPASLGALVPEFLAEVPRDFMDGQPLRYQLQPDGQFRLWSVGEDFKDDGGDPTPVGAPSINPFDWLAGRDWVWPQAASEAEVAAYHAELAAKRAVTPPKPPP